MLSLDDDQFASEREHWLSFFLFGYWLLSLLSFSFEISFLSGYDSQPLVQKQAFLFNLDFGHSALLRSKNFFKLLTVFGGLNSFLTYF